MTNAIKPKNITFKKVEAEWYDYHETVKEIARLRESIMTPFDEEPDTNVGGGSNSVRAISNPTERIATRLMTSKQLTYLTQIVEAIEKVYNVLPDEHKKLVQLRYWKKGNKLTWDGVANQIHVSDRTARRWRNEIIQATIEVLGWR